MRTFVSISLLILLAGEAFGACTEAQNSFAIKPEITYKRKFVVSGPDGKRIDQVSLEAPKAFEGLELVGITLSDGGILDASNFKIPVAFKASSKLARTEFSIDLDKVGAINVRIDYKNQECFRSAYKLIGG